MKKMVVVITGGPGFGKTSLIEKLNEEGFRTSVEFARDLIKNQLETGGDLLPWKDGRALQKAVLDYRVRFFEETETGEIAFADRGIPDQLAFFRYRGLKNSEFLMKKARAYRYYPAVFITSPWKKIYRQDKTRTETFQEACEIHQIICETYAELGYQLLELPNVSIQERIDFIKKQITEL